MNIYIFLLLLVIVCAEGFAPIALSMSRNEQAISSLRKDVSVIVTSSPSTKPNLFAVSGDSNESDDKFVGADDDIDDYDFERGFQERLKKEGGEMGVTVKSAKRSVDAASKKVRALLKISITYLA
jgi:hypothetical protein